MAPMIDMVFLLLVFFMCVSTLAQADKALPLDLPESAASEVPTGLAERGVVSVNSSGEVFVGLRKVSLPELGELIRDRLAADPRLRLEVRADRQTHYADVRKVLKVCAAAGAYDIIYATYQSR